MTVRSLSPTSTTRRIAVMKTSILIHKVVAPKGLLLLPHQIPQFVIFMSWSRAVPMERLIADTWRRRERLVQAIFQWRCKALCRSSKKRRESTQPGSLTWTMMKSNSTHREREAFRSLPPPRRVPRLILKRFLKMEQNMKSPRSR